jgi:hypothetical protein
MRTRLARDLCSDALRALMSRRPLFPHDVLTQNASSPCTKLEDQLVDTFWYPSGKMSPDTWGTQDNNSRNRLRVRKNSRAYRSFELRNSTERRSDRECRR